MARLSAGSGYRYLLRNTAVGDAEQSSTTPLTDYYAASGNPPGRWVGAGLAGLATGGGLPVGSRVSEEPLRRVFAGRDPVTGARLGRGFPTYSAHEGGKPRHAVAGFDLTFTVPKSVSVLWALAQPDTQARIVKTHREAVNEVLAFIERRVLVTRTGHGGVGQMATRGLVAASFDHWDTRSGDPNLHTHVVVANRVQGVDGAWRALDGRLLHKAAVAVSELYDDLLADRVAANLPVSWSYRDRGPRRTPAYELVGLEDHLLAGFSTRGADVTARTQVLASQFRGEHGRAPTRVERTRLAQRATRETRPPKSVHPLRDLLVDWRQRARLLTGQEPLDLARAALAGEYARPLRSLDVGPETMLAIANQVVSGVQARRSTWDVWNLHAEASRATRVLRMRDAGERLRLTDQVVATAVTQCVALDPPGTSSAPTLARQGQGAVYTSPAILDAERALLAANHATDGPTMSAATAERIASGPSPQLRPTRTRHDLLAADQAAAVIEIATSGRRVDVLVGPAGAGKTVTLAVLRLAWESGHGLGSVMGLAPSAAAAGELAEALRLTCETTAKWLWETSGPGAQARAQAAAQLTERSAAAAAAGDGQEARRCPWPRPSSSMSRTSGAGTPASSSSSTRRP